MCHFCRHNVHSTLCKQIPDSPEIFFYTPGFVRFLRHNYIIYCVGPISNTSVNVTGQQHIQVWMFMTWNYLVNRDVYDSGCGTSISFPLLHSKLGYGESCRPIYVLRLLQCHKILAQIGVSSRYVGNHLHRTLL